MPNLKQWLDRNYPGVKVEPVIFHRDVWLFALLTRDMLTGIGIPMIDFVIGPGEIYQWFEGVRYDGTQSLGRRNIIKLAKAEYKEDNWICIEKGRIDLTTK